VDDHRAEQQVRRLAFQAAEAHRPGRAHDKEEVPARLAHVVARQPSQVSGLQQFLQAIRADRQEAKSGLCKSLSDHAVAPRSYQPRLARTMRTTESMTGTSTSTPDLPTANYPKSRPDRSLLSISRWRKSKIRQKAHASSRRVCESMSHP
jgi:hypothetical protein